jgi:hypothetical protein
MKASCGPCVDKPSWNSQGTMLLNLILNVMHVHVHLKYLILGDLVVNVNIDDDDMDKQMRAKFIQEKEKKMNEKKLQNAVLQRRRSILLSNW